MNLQELIKKHDLKVNDEIVCISVDESERFMYGEAGKTYSLEISNIDGATMVLTKPGCLWSGEGATFELVKQKPTPHIHSEIIKAWADGAVIQYWDGNSNKWITAPNPLWGVGNIYRVKPDNTEQIKQIEDQISDLKLRIIELSE